MGQSIKPAQLTPRDMREQHGSIVYTICEYYPTLSRLQGLLLAMGKHREVGTHQESACRLQVLRLHAPSSRRTLQKARPEFRVLASGSSAGASSLIPREASRVARVSDPNDTGRSPSRSQYLELLSLTPSVFALNTQCTSCFSTVSTNLSSQLRLALSHLSTKRAACFRSAKSKHFRDLSSREAEPRI
jgi:hypothetical protein